MSFDPPRVPDPGRYSRDRQPGILTVPNIFAAARLAGSAALLWLAHAEAVTAFIALFATLVLSDWVDGKLAILLNQRTVIGARLDSIADVVMYACLLLGIAWLKPEFVRSEAALVSVVLVSYAVTIVAALVRFRRLPAYHTRAAKISWLLASVGAIALLSGGPEWLAQVAMLAVIVTNLEATAITLVLRQWRTDVPSIRHAIRARRD